MNRILRLFRQRTYAFALLLVVVLLVLNVVVSPSLFGLERLPATLATIAPFILVAFASTPSMLGGGIDISVGPLMVLVNCILVAVLIPAGLGSVGIALPILLAISAGIGALNGVLTTLVKINPVITTTGMLFVLIGVSLTIAKAPVSAPDNWTEPLADTVWLIPGAAITIGAVALAWFLLNRTAYVRNLLATGESDISAYGSGVNVTAVKIISYTLGGLFAGVGGIALTAFLQVSIANLGTTYALLGVAGAVLGGVSLLGGRGSMFGALLGGLAIYLIQQLLTAAGVAPTLISLSYGLVLVLAVILGATLLNPRKR